MRNRIKKTSMWTNRHLRRMSIFMVVCAIIFYLPVIGGAFGWTSAQDTLNNLHDFYGIDFYGLIFFAPVVYAAYTLGVMPAVLTALIAMLIFLPHTILIENYPNAFFKPTAFVIILSAVGAVVAMLQKSEHEHRQRMKEMKCLYDIGKAAEESHTTDGFLTEVVALIPQSMQYPEETKVSIQLRDKVFQSPGFQKSSAKITESLVVGGDTLGSIEIYSTRDNPYLKKRNHLTKTLAERISGAIRGLELEQFLQNYYEQLETEVDKRTKDLEQVQEKLIRSERLAAVGELASGVGHELRNPLNVIRNCAYLLNMSLGDKLDEEATKTIKVLDKQVDIANKIVSDLLDFTRIKPPSPTRVALDNLVKESLSWMEIPEKITVTNNVNGNSAVVKADAEQVGRVFSNIISNAIQAMNGKGELRIDTYQDDGYASVKFSDTGCGIPGENLEKIFEPLFTTKPKGIGLGLAITKRLVEQNQGKIDVVSQAGQGTTFTVMLPRENRR